MTKEKLLLIAAAVVVLGIILVATLNNSNDQEELASQAPADHADELTEYEIAPAQVVARVEDDKDVVLLDVRTPEEYAEIHLEGARLLPVQELSAGTLAEIGLGEDAKDKEIIIYCRSGARSKTAYDIMKSLGYTNIKSVAGGMIHWQEDNYPLTETGVYQGGSANSTDQVNQSNQPQPVMALDRNTHDFGVIPQYGGTVQTDFVVTNTGAETLEIGELTTSCSCASATISNSKISPNESATLTVVFDPDLHEEPFDKFQRTVFIPTNDPNQLEAEITVSVDIDEGN